MKKISKILLSLLLLVVMIGSNVSKKVEAKGDTIKPVTLIINGEVIATDVDPIVSSNRTLIPFRSLEVLNLTFEWNHKTKTVIINNNKDTLKLQLNSKVAYKNGEEIQLDAPPTAVNGRTMVPLRFVSEAFGYKVLYEPERVIVFIDSADYKNGYHSKMNNSLIHNRLLDISLPLISNFETLKSSQTNLSNVYSYVFQVQHYGEYIYDNGKVLTYVDIVVDNDGQATAKIIWQGERGKGNTFTKEIGKRPNLEAFYANGIKITHLANDTVRYEDTSRSPSEAVIVPFQTYKDIVQKLSYEEY